MRIKRKIQKQFDGGMAGKYDQGQILTEVDKYPTFDELLMQYMSNPI